MAEVGLGWVQDAAKTLQHALELGNDAAATHNLLVCCYALGDVPAMQDNFQKLVQVSLNHPLGLTCQFTRAHCLRLCNMQT